MKIAVIGTGYVGLISGICFSEFGHNVVCVDKLTSKIEDLNNGHLPIYELGLEAVMAHNFSAGRLTFTSDLNSALKGADAVFIAVGTPSRRGDGHADLSYVMAAATEISTALTGYTVIVTKSTVPVGTNKKVAESVFAANPHAEFDVVSNPEFLREGAALQDFMMPDRVIIGVESEKARRVMREIYHPLDLQNIPIIYTGIETAEMIKYAANAFLATKISFINEIAALCEHVGANINDVSNGMGLDSRIGHKFLHAGPGYGGSCFPKDTTALARIGQENGMGLRIIEAVIAVNDATKRRMIDKIFDICGGTVKGQIITVLGATFKPDTDDVRESPALTIIPALIGGGANVRVVDPQGRREGEAMLPGVAWYEDPYNACEDAHLVVLLTEWSLYRSLSLKRLSAHMATPKMADLRNIYSLELASEAGFTAYQGVGIGMAQVT